LVDFILGAVVAAVLLGPVAWADARSGVHIGLPVATVQHGVGAAGTQAITVQEPDALGKLARLVSHLL
jgi:hypothetical protein